MSKVTPEGEFKTIPEGVSPMEYGGLLQTKLAPSEIALEAVRLKALHAGLQLGHVLRVQCVDSRREAILAWADYLVVENRSVMTTTNDSAGNPKYAEVARVSIVLDRDWREVEPAKPAKKAA